MSDLDTFTRTALPSSVRLEPGAGGLPRLAIATRLATAEIYLQGAHVTAWVPRTANASAAPASTPATPAGIGTGAETRTGTGSETGGDAVADSILWVSRESHFAPGSAIRGGVPICFPWFGAHATDTAAPAHGFARIRPWSLIEAREHEDGAVALTFELVSGDVRPPQWPHAFRATHRITIGPTLSMELQVANPGAEPFTFEEALHTYFAVQDVRAVTVTGLEDTEYLDKVANFAKKPQGADPIRFTQETDRVYLDTRTPCVLHDPGKRRRITITKAGSNSTVVWNPWVDKARAMPDFGDIEWPEMACVETCNVNVDRRTLGPGETQTMTATLDVQSL
jgi:D-hexose-6-phosphate mutarotase